MSYGKQVVWCPKSPKRHKRFGTPAHVMQDWEVDETGEFLRVIDDSVQTDHGPHLDNIWTCMVCGADAVKKDPAAK